jgi:hypothetical protein
VTFRAIVARSLLVFSLAAGAGMAATPAHAQHVVTDGEAGKLTLDALTATPAPVVHRVAYRSLSRRSPYLPAAARVRMGGSRRAVREVSWHRPGRLSPATHAVAHSRTRRRG